MMICRYSTSMCGQFIPVNGRRVFPARDMTISADQLAAFFNGLTTTNLAGRKPLRQGELQGMPCLERTFHHGGILRAVLRDRFWERNPRALRECRLLEDLQDMGLPVVRPVLAWTAGTGPVYRQGLVTVRECDAMDLSAVDEVTVNMAAGLVCFLEAFFDAGLIHPDLNIKNILYRSSDETFRMLDFDKAARATGSLGTKQRVRIWARLFRSFDKMDRLDMWDNAAPGQLPPHVRTARLRYERIRGFRAFLWKLNRK